MLRRKNDCQKFSDQFGRCTKRQSSERSRFFLGNQDVGSHVPDIVMKCHGKSGRFCIEPAELPLFGTTKRAQPGEQPDSFEQIGLSLSVLSKDDVNTGRRLKIDFRQITVIGNV